MLLSHLQGASWWQSDLRGFHAQPSAWVQAGIDRTVDEIHDVESHVDSGHVWYADYRPPLDPTRRVRMTTARQPIQRALPLMTDMERMAMGTTYGEAFGSPSESIHYSATAHERSSGEWIPTVGTKLAMLGFCIARRCHLMLGQPAGPHSEQITRVLDANQQPTALFRTLTERSGIAVGDFVLARGYLGEVVEDATSQFGYRSLRVEFLAERPLPDLDADWFRARDVVRIFSRDAITAGVIRVLGRDVQVDGNDLRSSVLAAWDAGLRDEVARRTRGR